MSQPLEPLIAALTTLTTQARKAPTISRGVVTSIGPSGPSVLIDTDDVSIGDWWVLGSPLTTGQRVLALWWEGYRAVIGEEPTTKTWTPTWYQAGGANLTIGNGTLTGTWTQVGTTVTWNLLWVRGTTSSLGSGSYAWTLPTPAADWRRTTGAGYLLGNGETPLTVRPLNANAFVALTPSGRVSSTNPGNWAGGEIISLAGTYQALTA